MEKYRAFESLVNKDLDNNLEDLWYLTEDFDAQCGDSLDFTINIDIYSWQISSRLLSHHSSVFSMMCYGNFREAREHTIELRDDDPIIFCHFLQWLHTGDLVIYTDIFCNWPKFDTDWYNVETILKRGKALPGPDNLSRPYGEDDRDDLNYGSWLIVEANDFAEVMSSLWAFADKYDIPKLMGKIAEVFCALPKSDKYLYFDNRTELFWACRQALIDIGLEDDPLAKAMFAHAAVLYHVDELGNMQKEIVDWMEEDLEFAIMVVAASSREMSIVKKLNAKQLEERVDSWNVWSVEKKIRREQVRLLGQGAELSDSEVEDERPDADVEQDDEEKSGA